MYIRDSLRDVHPAVYRTKPDAFRSVIYWLSTGRPAGHCVPAGATGISIHAFGLNNMTMKQRYHSVPTLLSGLLLTLSLSGCLSDGSELIPEEQNVSRPDGVFVGLGVNPVYAWNVGPIASLTVVRTSNPTTPVWGFSVFTGDLVPSPVTHGDNVPNGSQSVGGTEPTLTPGVQYRVLIERRTEGRTFTAFFVPPDGSNSGIPTQLSRSAASVRALSMADADWSGDGGGRLDKDAPGLKNVVAIAAGGAHSLAVTAEGTVWSWGANGSGQLGDGSTADSAAPVQVRGLSNVTAVAAGDRHSLALTADGAMWAWGENSNSQLGDGTTVNRNTPVPVALMGKVTAIAAGKLHSMALAEDGTVWSWGDNTRGQLGDGTVAGAAAPVQVTKQ